MNHQEMSTIHERSLNFIPFSLKCSSRRLLFVSSASLSRLLLERAHLFPVHDLFVYTLLCSGVNCRAFFTLLPLAYVFICRCLPVYY